MQIFVGKMATHPNLIHSKQWDNSNRDNIYYCNSASTITKGIDVNTGKLSEAFIPLSNCNRYDVETCKAKGLYLSNAGQKASIKNVFVPNEKFVLPEKKMFSI